MELSAPEKIKDRLNQELKRYENLIVIKSISKSYGVPGLRLGILASGNNDIINILNNN